MKIAALIIGIFGAIAGFVGALLGMLLGGLGSAFGAEGAATVGYLSLGGLGVSIVALVGAALVLAKPRFSALVMAGSAIVGLVLISAAFVVATVLLLIAALLAFLGRDS